MQRIEITIQEIAQKKKQFIAYFQSGFYDATYSVIVRL